MSAKSKGVLDERMLPSVEFDALWDAIIDDRGIKDRILCQAMVNFSLRPKLKSSGRLPLHGIILLVGPPGTAKTTLARALASRTARMFPGQSFRFIEVEPHALASSSLGRSQQAVRDLLGTVVAEAAESGPLIVLLDEVETLAADRSKMSLEANPVDVHRATDAVLAQIDHLATSHPNILFIATSNFPGAIDAAFVSRADLVVDVGLPGAAACRAILADTVAALAELHPNLKHLVNQPAFARAAEQAVGLDGRRLRKVVLAALTGDKQMAANPSLLTAEAILASVMLARAANDAQLPKLAAQGAV
jgi:pachytene checkpoint protein 2